jgi:hypothetical protein
VWLVLDGETLYVDRNANGDLTEPGEKVVARQLGQGDLLSFSAGDISDGKLVHKGLSLDFQDLAKFAENDAEIKELHTKEPKVLGCMLFLNVAIPGWKGPGPDGRITHLIALRDANGFLQFAARPQQAPIIHFGGQWQITLYAKQKLTIGRETDLILAMGTPGQGPGTTAFVAYDGVIPEKAYSKVTITYPPTQPGQPPLKELYELKKRC